MAASATAQVKSADDDAVDDREAGAALREAGRDEHGDVRAERALVVLQLRDPAVAPVPSRSCTPRGWRPRAAAARIDDDLVEVRAADALRDRRDVVPRERRTQAAFELRLAGLALELL
jgi:hypothetical protein